MKLILCNAIVAKTIFGTYRIIQKKDTLIFYRIKMNLR